MWLLSTLCERCNNTLWCSLHLFLSHFPFLSLPCSWPSGSDYKQLKMIRSIDYDPPSSTSVCPCCWLQSPPDTSYFLLQTFLRSLRALSSAGLWRLQTSVETPCPGNLLIITVRKSDVCSYATKRGAAVQHWWNKAWESHLCALITLISFCKCAVNHIWHSYECTVCASCWINSAACEYTPRGEIKQTSVWKISVKLTYTGYLLISATSLHKVRVPLISDVYIRASPLDLLL